MRFKKKKSRERKFQLNKERRVKKIRGTQDELGPQDVGLGDKAERVEDSVLIPQQSTPRLGATRQNHTDDSEAGTGLSNTTISGFAVTRNVLHGASEG